MLERSGVVQTVLPAALLYCCADRPSLKPAKGGGKALLAFAGVCVLGLISVPLWKLILITFTANHLISEGDVAVK